MRHERDKKAIATVIVVAALGYFVDIYDLILFSIVRVKSLRAIGVPESDLLNQGIHLINLQMFGMLLGGILWGVLGDKRGRLSVLFGSILLYSIANIANAFVTTIGGYAAMRFIAGVGLAGELGAGITLVSETMGSESRGLGTSFVAGVGIFGAVAAYVVGERFSWSTAYLVGGVMGLVLLCFRIGVMESTLFQRIREAPSARGDFLSLFAEPRRALRYLSVIFVGIPLWFVVGILMTFSPEIGKAMGMSEPPAAGRAVMFCYVGLAISDVASGAISMLLRSRKRTIFVYVAATALAMLLYFVTAPLSADAFYWICFALGLGCGYWAMFVTVASEQFGTNIRATAATTVPNFVRGAVPLLTSLFQLLKPSLGVPSAAASVGFSTLLIAAVASMFLEETYGKDLDYTET